MVAWMIDSYGTDAQRHEWLPRLTAMTDFGAYCLTEPGAGSDAAAIATTRDPRRRRLRADRRQAVHLGWGRGIRLCRDGAHRRARRARDHRLPRARATPPGLSFGAEREEDGLERPADAPGDPRRGAGAGDRALLGVEGQGFKIAMAASTAAASTSPRARSAARSGRSTGRCSTCKERFTFGEPLAEKQSVVFTLADMATELRAARALVRDAAIAIDEKAPDAAMQCAMAKRFATDAGFRVANEALQLHGGYGYLQDYGIEKVVRDLRVHQILEGTNEIMRVIIGRELLRADRRSAGTRQR